MKPLVLVKHSLPEIVETVPAREWKLSESGRSRARKLAELLIPYQPDIVASSVEPKAYETACILAKAWGLPVHPATGLHEHDRSSEPYLSAEEFKNLVQNFFKKPDLLLFGTETAADALFRFRGAIDSILSLHENECLLIVSHGTVISLFASWLTGCDGYALWQELDLPSFVVLDLKSRALLKIVNLSGGE